MSRSRVSGISASQLISSHSQASCQSPQCGCTHCPEPVNRGCSYPLDGFPYVLRILTGYALPGKAWEGWSVHGDRHYAQNVRWYEANSLEQIEQIFGPLGAKNRTASLTRRPRHDPPQSIKPPRCSQAYQSDEQANCRCARWDGSHDPELGDGLPFNAKAKRAVSNRDDVVEDYPIRASATDIKINLDSIKLC